jgi:hypothetical protein
MDGYLDGELDPITSQPIEQPLRDRCNCDQAYEAHGALIHAIGRAASYYKAFSRAIAPSATGSRTFNPKTLENAGTEYPQCTQRLVSIIRESPGVF